MNDAQLLEQLSLTDAYAPDTAMPSAALQHGAAFAEVEQLINAWVPDGPAANLPLRPIRTRMLMAPVALLVVLVAGIALFASIRFSQGTELATTPPTPSTTLSPTTPSTTPEVDPAALTFIESIVDDINSGDGSKAAQLVLAAEEFDGPFFEEPDENDERPRMAGTVRYWAALDSELTIDECTTVSSGVTRCELSRISEHEAFYPEPERSVWRVRLEGDTVAFLSYAPGLSLVDPREYREWLQQVSPETATAIATVADPVAAAEAQKRYVALWRSENGKLP